MNETQVNENLRSPPARWGWIWRWAWGGLPRGRVVKSLARNPGQTTLCLQVVAEAQKLGGTCAFIDAETRWIRNTPASWAWMWMTC